LDQRLAKPVVTTACVGYPETDGVAHYLNVTEKRNRKRRKILLDAARPVLAYIDAARIKKNREGPPLRPLRPNSTGLVVHHLERKTPGGWSSNTARRPAST
jgi:hypothetical protein